MDGTSTTLALSAPDGWTRVLLGALLTAARTKTLLFVTCKDDRRSVDSMVTVVVWRAVCRMDGRGKWDSNAETKVADVLGPATWFGRWCSE